MPGAASSRRPLAFISCDAPVPVLRQVGGDPLSGRLRGNRAAELLVQSDEPVEPEAAHRCAAVGDGVVRSSSIRSWSRVRERRWDPLEQRGRPAREPEGDVHRWPPGAERGLEPAPELAPRDRLRPAELERRRGPPPRPRSVRRGRDRRSRWAESAGSPGRSPASPEQAARTRSRRGRAPPSTPKTKLGRSTAWSTPDDATACSAAHLARKYGTVAPGPVPSALMRTIRRTSLSRAASTRLPVPTAITRSNAARRALEDRDEVHDRAHTPGGRAERCRVGDVAADELAVDALECLRTARGAHHRPHPDAGRGQLTHDVVTDEAACTGDEDHRSSVKFCQ